MDSELIVQILNNACQYDNLNFQIILRESILHIYINRKVDSDLNYNKLVKDIGNALKKLDAFWQGFWLYSRVIGQIEPDWQTYVELSDNKSDPLIEQTENLIKEAKKSLEELKYLKDDDVLAVEELDESILDKNSFLLATESAEEIDNSAQEIEEEDLLEVEELDESILDQNTFFIVDEVDHTIGERTKKDFDDLFAVEELDESILDKDSHLLAKESAEEIDDSQGEILDEELKDLFSLEELDESSLGNDDPHLLAKEPAEEIDNSQEEISENDLDTLFVKEKSDDKINNKKFDKIVVDYGNKIENLDQSKRKKIFFLEYCFIRNKRLLESDLVSPKLNIAHLVNSFHDLSSENKKLLLPLLSQYFELQETLTEKEKENFSPEIKEWVQKITELSSEETRKAAIWISRYCFNPEKTIAEIQKVFDAEVAKQEAERQTEKKSASLEHNQNTNGLENSSKLGVYTGTKNKKCPNHHQSSKYLPSNITYPKQEVEPEAARSKLSPGSINILVPIIWTAVTIIFAFLGVTYANSNSVNLEGSSIICENIINAESADYCQLTVDLVGQQRLEEEISEALAFSDDRKSLALSQCETYTNFIAGVPLPKKYNSIKSYGEEILPGIYVAEVEQENAQAGDNTIRVACTFVNKEYQTTRLASDIIPNNWPLEKYQDKNPIKETPTTEAESFDKVFGIYSIFMVMGFGSLFTAIGLFAASMLDWGITIYSLDALYKSAFILGILEVIVSLIPVLGLFAAIALKTLMLGITSACVKGLKVNWSDGYSVVCLGTVTILGIRAILNFLMILVISSFIA